MAEKIDLYRIHKSEYATPKKPAFIETKPAKYLTIRGKGEPGGTEFQAHVGALYAMAWTIKMSSKFAGRDYRVCHLEGRWWGQKKKLDFSEPAKNWNWKLLIRVPDFIEEQHLRDAAATLKEKGKAPGAGKVKLETIDEGLCVQMLHVGPYAEETKTIEQMMAAAEQKHVKMLGPHHEIYLSDPRRVPPERLRTILRHPVG